MNKKELVIYALDLIQSNVICENCKYKEKQNKTTTKFSNGCTNYRCEREVVKLLEKQGLLHDN